MTPPAPAAQGASGRIGVFGAVLATDRPLPGLPVAPIGDGQLPFWDLTTTETSDPVRHHATATPVGQMRFSSGVDVSLAATADAHEIVISDTGRFTLSADGRQIRHHAPNLVDRDAVALDLLGVVLPFALHRSGAWCLHASAVRTTHGALVFLAQSGTGKSTLAAACMSQGCALVADDVVVLRDTGHGISVTPAGVPLRLRAGTARDVGVGTTAADASWGKVRIAGPVALDALPVAAIYVLQPVAADAPVERARRTTRAAALALVANGKITELLGTDADGEVLSRCVAIAHAAAVFDLAIPRDLSRLTDVTRALLAWHADVRDAVTA